MKVDLSSVNVGPNKSHNSEKFNRKILPNGYNIPSSATKDATKNECKSFDIGTCVTLFGLENLKFNEKFGVVESPLEPSDRQDVILHSPPLQFS